MIYIMILITKFITYISKLINNIKYIKDEDNFF